MFKKNPIIIASVLKPVDDSRMLYKLGFSICETNKYDLNIIGFSSKKTPKVKNIRLIEIFSASRTSLTRLFVPAKFFKKLFRIKPAVVIVTTFELLPVATVGKWLLSYKLVYDVQENYAKNIAANRTLPRFWRRLAILLVKASESFSRKSIDHYVFAEQCYASEMPTIKNYTVVENKAILPKILRPPFRLSNPSAPHFILSGTITEVYGLIPAIEWYLKLYELLPKAQLTIVGHCPMAGFSKKLAQQYGGNKGIHLKLSEQPFPVGYIQDQIRQADILLLPYLLLPGIKNKMPTKLYEGIALQKVILISDNPVWKTIVDKYPAGKAIDFFATDQIQSLWETLCAMEFYQFPPDESIDWQHEKKKIQLLIQNLSLQ